ncbi:MAG: hypothetical protein ACR2FY_15765 [Pirellulaceae bacterium]
MSLPVARLAVVISSLLLLSSVGFADEKEQLDGFVKGWLRWRDRTANAEVRYSKASKGVNTTNKALTEDTQWYLRQKGDLWRADRDKLNPAGKRQIDSWVIGASESYYLTAADDAGPWTLLFRGTDPIVKEQILDARGFVEMPWSICGFDLASVTSKPPFKIKKTAPAKSPYGDSWEIDFTYQPADPKSTAIRGGKMLVGKDVDFGIIHGDFQTDWGSVVVDNVFAIRRDGPVLLSSKQSALNKAGAGFIVEFDLKNVELGKKLAGEVFTLSAFGLADETRPLIPMK